ncbi:hypothetical protein [Bradyrhizobium liaoningense]|nr:hypothetical protein [Bradyrhizobium liaoningense]
MLTADASLEKRAAERACVSAQIQSVPFPERLFELGGRTLREF